MGAAMLDEASADKRDNGDPTEKAEKVLAYRRIGRNTVMDIVARRRPSHLA